MMNELAPRWTPVSSVRRPRFDSAYRRWVIDSQAQASPGSRGGVAVRTTAAPEAPVGRSISVASLHALGLARTGMAATAAQENLRIERGDRGPEVQDLQRSLSRHGYLIRCDGVFGTKTERALRSFQGDYGLEMSGWMGEVDRVALSGGKATRMGDRGSKVRLLQEHLHSAGYDVRIDGEFGQQTQSVLRSFQRSMSLPDTGVLSEATRVALEPARDPFTLRRGDRGPSVFDAQRALMRHGYRTEVDGSFTLKTENVLRRFQFEHGLEDSGRLDDTTRAVLLGPVALRSGDQGPEVERLQAALVEEDGAELAIDGVFGPQTEAALMEAQQDWSLRPTGVAYPKTAMVLKRQAAFERFDPTTWKADGDAQAHKEKWRALDESDESGAQIVAGIDDAFLRGCRTLASADLAAAQPVRFVATADPKPLLDALGPDQVLVLDLCSEGRMAGEGLHPLLGATGMRGADDVSVSVRRGADDFTIEWKSRSARAYSGVLQQTLSRLRRRQLAMSSAAASAELSEAPGHAKVVALTFGAATASSASRIVGSLIRRAWAPYLHDDESANDASRDDIDAFLVGFERGQQIAGKGGDETVATHAARRVRVERGETTDDGRIIDIVYRYRAPSGRRVGDYTADIEEERRIWPLHAADADVGPESGFDELVAAVPDDPPAEIELVRRSGGRQTTKSDQIERITKEERLVIDQPDDTYDLYRSEIQRDWANADSIVDAVYTRRVSRAEMSAADESVWPSVHYAVEGSAGGLLFYRVRFTGTANVVREHEVERVRKSSYE